MTADDAPLLAVRDLAVEFDVPGGTVHAVNGIDLAVGQGEVVGLVGESGCGKTVAVLAVLGLLPPTGRVVRGEAWFGRRDLLRLSQRELRRVRGREIAMVFQDPLTSLHPAMRVGDQVAEALEVHDASLTRRAAARRAVELLDLVGIPDPPRRSRDHPHRWSGGMRQRAVIAMAVANRPALIIADEPTTALDVTVQAQVLDVLTQARRETGAAVVLITHDLGVVAEVCDRVVVVYAGRVVETAPVHELFRHPRHPYTAGLLASVPRLEGPVRLHDPIPGQPPTLLEVPAGCAFADRCALGAGREQCRAERPLLRPVGGRGHQAACHLAGEHDGADGAGR
ncbi:MAG: ABC transporter ATP-binding protein [Actinomycetota bacterium]|nr:ABC transporter ATP-binding protein [Actinomycetota bacterium]